MFWIYLEKISDFLVAWQQFFAGILISCFIYCAQKRDDEKAQRDLIMVWQKLVDQKGASIEKTINEKITKILKNPNKIQALDAEYNKTNLILKNSFQRKDENLYLLTALEYKKIAEKRADLAAEEYNFDLLSSTGTLTTEDIKRVHSTLFPKGYVWAGKFRKQVVVISGIHNTGGRSIESSLSSFQTKLLDPNKVEDEMKKLIKRWNGIVKQLSRMDAADIARELAEFHHTFLYIHPFLDGNGRISRVILNEQATFLMKKNIKFKFDRDIYYKALHLADQRKPEDLIALIGNQLK